jgi:hypothetical protein
MLVRRFSFAVLLLAIALGGCRAVTPTSDSREANAAPAKTAPQKASTQSATFTSSDGKTQLVVPHNWAKAENPNSTATLEVKDPSGEIDISVQSELKEKFQGLFSLQQFAEMSRDVSAGLFQQPQISEAKQLTINGYSALQSEVRGEFGGFNLIQVHTTVETPEYYHHILAVLPSNKFEKEQAIVQQAIASFKEAK